MTNNELKIYPTGTPEELAHAIVHVLDDKLAENIKVLHVTEKTIIADYFVICTGRSSTQIKALADEVEYRIGLCGADPGHVEGADTASWICMDYHSVIVHIFNEESRDTYRLEKLWDDAEEIDISGDLTER